MFPENPNSTGGPGTFQNLITKCMIGSGFTVLPGGSDEKADLVFIVGGTKKLGWIKRHKRKGAKVLHRLDGLKWRHWVEKTPLKYKILFMLQNRMTSYIRSNFADVIVYQSQFVKDWWNEQYGKIEAYSEIIPNGTDLDHFKPSENEAKARVPTLVCFEGNIDFDEPTVFTLREIGKSLVSKGFLKEVLIWGNVKDKQRNKLNDFPGIRLMGGCKHSEVAENMRKGDIFLSLDVNAACPNSVIEAMASGLPIVGFQTGALNELVCSSAGELSSYGSDPWKLEKPDAHQLVTAIKNVLLDLENKKLNARKIAEERFGMHSLANNYIETVRVVMNSTG